jgi:hypothetical protein
VGKDGSDSIASFLRQHVFPLEDYFAAHHYRDIRCYDEYSNTPLEGTNGGLKYCENSVLPSMGMDEAAVIMIGQDGTKGDSKKRKVSEAFHKTPVYTDSSTSRYITQVAECMLQTQLSESEKYASLRNDDTTWLVVRSAERPNNNSGSLVAPIFERMRRLTLDKNGVLHCECGYTKRNGIPCRHIAHVAYNYSSGAFPGFTYQDTSIRWTTSYAKFVAVDDTSVMDIDGHKLRTKLMTTIEPKEAWCPKAPIVASLRYPIYKYGRCSSGNFRAYTQEKATDFFLNYQGVKVYNYSQIDVNKAKQASHDGSTYAVAMTQETFNGSDDDDDNFDFFRAIRTRLS